MKKSRLMWDIVVAFWICVGAAFCAGIALFFTVVSDEGGIPFMKRLARLIPAAPFFVLVSSLLLRRSDTFQTSLRARRLLGDPYPWAGVLLGSFLWGGALFSATRFFPHLLGELVPNLSVADWVQLDERFVNAERGVSFEAQTRFITELSPQVRGATRDAAGFGPWLLFFATLSMGGLCQRLDRVRGVVVGSWYLMTAVALHRVGAGVQTSGFWILAPTLLLLAYTAIDESRVVWLSRAP